MSSLDFPVPGQFPGRVLEVLLAGDIITTKNRGGTVSQQLLGDFFVDIRVDQIGGREPPEIVKPLSWALCGDGGVFPARRNAADPFAAAVMKDAGAAQDALAQPPSEEFVGSGQTLAPPVNACSAVSDDFPGKKDLELAHSYSRIAVNSSDRSRSQETKSTIKSFRASPGES